MNTFIIKSKNGMTRTFKGVKLSDCIVKLGSGKVKWEKYEIYHTIHNNFVFVKGFKPCLSERYDYEVTKCTTFSEVINLVKHQNPMVHPLLSRMVKAAFDIFYAGVRSKEIKDRKYRLSQKLKQMSLFPLDKAEEEKSKATGKICYK